MSPRMPNYDALRQREALAKAAPDPTHDPEGRALVQAIHDRKARTTEVARPSCEAEERIARTLYAMKNDWHDGTFDYGKIKAMLTGRDTADCAEQCGTSD